jgi:hypothetical protein
MELGLRRIRSTKALTEVKNNSKGLNQLTSDFKTSKRSYNHQTCLLKILQSLKSLNKPQNSMEKIEA